MIPRTCDICEQAMAGPGAVSCPDHPQMHFHLSCFVARESLTGFGCEACDREERQESED
jgi:hypothetical protein